MSSEDKILVGIIASAFAVVITLVLTHLNSSKKSSELIQRIDDAEKSQTQALGEWSRSMSQHISDSIAALANNARLLQGQHEDHSKLMAARHEETINVLGEQHRRNLEKLADRNELSNKELARQYAEILGTLRGTVEEIDARLAKTDQSNQELRQAIKELRDTLETAVKL